MTPEQIAELESAATAAAAKAAEAGGTDEDLNKAAEDAKAAFEKAKADAPSNDPVKKELEEVRRPKSEKEKARHVLLSTAERLRVLGEDPSKILGVAPKSEESPSSDDDSEVPEWYKQEKAKDAQKTARQMADSIEDPYERDLTIHHLENTIRPSGNPNQDLKAAKDMVIAAKARHIIEEQARKNPPKEHGSGGGAPPRQDSDAGVELTAEEMAYTRPPWNLTKAVILSKRPKG